MYQASNNYRNLIDSGIRGQWSSRIDLSSGYIPCEDISKIVHYTPYMSSLSIGNVVSSYINVTITNQTINLLNDTLEPQIILEGEEIPLGIFTVYERPQKNENLMSVIAYDNVIKLQKYYSTTLEYPTSIENILEEISVLCGVQFTHDIYPDIEITEAYELKTCSEVVSKICTIIGKNLVADRNGKLVFRWFNTTPITIDPSKHHKYSNSESTTVYNTIKCKVDDEITIASGEFGETLEIESKYITQEQLDSILDNTKMEFTSGSCDFIGDPTIDVGDKIIVKDLQENPYLFPIMNYTFTFDGGCYSSAQAYGIETSVKSLTDIINDTIDSNKTIGTVLNDVGVLQGEVNQATGDAAKALLAVDRVNTTASSALISADSKSTVFYLDGKNDSSGKPTVVPTGYNGLPLKVNDLWFNTGDGNCSYRWNGSSWEKKAYGNGAIDSLDAGKINTGELAADRIAANTILAKILSVGGLSADYINVNDLKAIVARIGGFDIDDSRIYSSKTMADGKVGYVFMSNDFYSSQNSIPYNPVFGVMHDNEWKWFVRSNGAMYGKDVDFRGQLATYSNTDSNTYSSVSAGNIYSQGLDNDNYKSIWIHNGAIDLNRVDASTYKNRNVVTSDLTQMYDSNGDLFVDMNSITGNIGFYKTVNIVASPSSDNALKLYNTSRKECSITYQNNTNRYTVGLGVGGNVGNFAIWDGGQILESLDANGNKTVLGDLRSYRVLSNANSGNTVGLASNRWNTGYFNTVYNSSGAITTSDRSSKKEFTAFDDRYYNLAEIIDLQLFKYIDGTSDRYHIGAVAQDVAVAMEQCEITLDECGIVCIEHWRDEDGNEQEMYNIRYDELNVLMNWYNRKRISDQQNEIDELRQMVSSLLKQLNN